ncbi:hypothetical protein K458DRAFT_69372 [Lentithecium fluviatile CBS 122367]|uniref:Uncharacterized protein n=1 Tax=Lentithecium fluviatile CBS 122367 TaxID=1168545 RepID=A0A6G1JLZ6_9PLEO|nr:hypothetical protein K458DRAFT_69372 [Lentithecium fluviatile CBS 122367]
MSLQWRAASRLIGVRCRFVSTGRHVISPEDLAREPETQEPIATRNDKETRNNFETGNSWFARVRLEKTDSRVVYDAALATLLEDPDVRYKIRGTRLEDIVRRQEQITGVRSGERRICPPRDMYWGAYNRDRMLGALLQNPDIWRKIESTDLGDRLRDFSLPTHMIRLSRLLWKPVSGIADPSGSAHSNEVVPSSQHSRDSRKLQNISSKTFSDPVSWPRLQLRQHYIKPRGPEFWRRLYDISRAEHFV